MRDDALAQWLALREASDAASRSETVTRMVLDAIAPHDPLRILDLATGTGSNIRYLLGRLNDPAPGVGRAWWTRQRWMAVDQSSALLTQLPDRMSVWAAERGYDMTRESMGCVVRGNGVECLLETMQLDLATLPSADVVGAPHLVTASALLDLVSESWLRSLAALCCTARAAALFAITYNGRSSCSPAEPEDKLVLNLFNQHQRTDKGLGGTAAGPDAVACVVRAFSEAGYLVCREPSDWNIGAHETEFQRQLVEGWAEAATEIDPRAASTIARWRERRLQHVDAGRSHLVVGHDDVGAWLPTSQL